MKEKMKRKGRTIGRKDERSRMMEWKRQGGRKNEMTGNKGFGYIFQDFGG